MTTAGRWALALLVLVAGAAACGTGGGGGPSPSSSESELRPVLVLRLLDSLPGPLDYCDPDLYPIGVGPPLPAARRRLPEIRAHRAIYRAILEYRHITVPLSDREVLTLSADYKHIQAVRLTQSGGRFGFDVLVRPPGNAGDERIVGTIGQAGDVHVDRRALHQAPPGCPICLSRGTVIGAPEGSVRVEDVNVGMVVWTTDRGGRRVHARVVRVGRTSVPPSHRMVRLVLADGRSVVVSPGHPAADGTPVGDLRPGQPFEGPTVVSAERVPLSGRFTYDLLPSGPTRTYFADGVLLRSTLSAFGDSIRRGPEP